MNRKISSILFIATCLTVDFASSQSCLGTKGLGKWVRARDGAVPAGAVSGGLDKKRIEYICRSGGICGKVMESTPCYYAYYKEESSDDSYDVLTNVDGVWVPVVAPHLPCNILKTGNAVGDSLYSCRVMYKKCLTIGKVENNVCIIGYNGAIHKYKTNYEIFTAVPESLELPKGKEINLKADGKYLAFQVKADDEAVVTFGNGDDMLYSVAIGALENSVVSMGPVNSRYENFKHAPGILSGSEFKSFWIRWTSDKLEFGKENDLKETISYKDKGVKNINSIRLSSTFGSSEWKIASLINN